METKEYRKAVLKTGALAACLLTILVAIFQANDDSMTIPQMAAEVRGGGLGLPMNSGSIIELVDWLEPNIIGNDRTVRIIYNDAARTMSDSIDIPDVTAPGAREQIAGFAHYSTGVYDAFWSRDCADGAGDYEVMVAIWNERNEIGFYAGRSVRQDDKSLIYIEDYPGFISDFQSERSAPDGFVVSTGHGDAVRIPDTEFNTQLASCLGFNIEP